VQRTKVIGPPGTGKTTWLIERAAWFIETGYDPASIVATTFTKPGRRAIREKVLQILKPKGLVKSSGETHWIGRTIHSICRELLDIPHENVLDDRKLKEFADAYHYKLSIFEAHSFGADGEYRDIMLETPEDFCLFFIDWWRHRMYPKAELAFSDFVKQHFADLPQDFSKPQLMLFLKRYDEFKRENHLWDFTDFLIGTLRERVCPEEIKLLFCDEAQDFSPLLLNVTVMWESKAERSFYIGDPNQALYGFMGGDHRLLADMPCEKTIQLTQSNRVPRIVWEKDKRLLEKFQLWYKEGYLPRDDDGFVVRGRAPFWSELPFQGKKVFIQHRTRRLAREFGEMLLDMGVPFKALRGRQSPLDKEEVRVVGLLERLGRGEAVTMGEMAKLIADTSFIPSALYLEKGAKTRMKKLAEQDPEKKVRRDNLPELGFNMRFVEKFVEGKFFDLVKLDEKERTYLVRAFRKYGSLLGRVEIYNGTVHAFKGEECHIAIINPTLTGRTAQALVAAPYEEAKIFHTALTRAREGVYILPSQRAMGFPI